jgi:hypothetical protein
VAAIHDVSNHDGLKDSRWDKIKGWVKDRADVIEKVADIAGVVAAAAGVEEAPVPGLDRPLRPDGVTERISADGLPDVVLEPPADPPAGYADLLALLRALRDDDTESPLAAIELDVTGPPLRARLRHVGSEPLAVRLGTLTLEATLFGADSTLLDSATVSVDASGEGAEVGPGWSLAIAHDLAVAGPANGGFLAVTVGTPEVDVYGDGVLHPVELGWMAE